MDDEEKSNCRSSGIGFFVSLHLALAKRMIVNCAGIAQLVDRVRMKRPVVHVLANWVTASDVASGLHAIGARPIMAQAEEEIEEVVSRANAVVLNLGTLDPVKAKVLFQAGRHAKSLNLPVVLDPVGVGASRFRKKTADSLLSQVEVCVIRGNRAEIGFLAGQGGDLKGIDAVAGPPDLLSAAKALSEKTGAVVAATGPRDLVMGGAQRIFVENGHPMMAQVTGMGCLLSAVIGAFVATEINPWTATIGAVAFFGLAGERAGSQAKGPGTFKVAFLDTLYTLSPDEVDKGVRLSEV